MLAIMRELLRERGLPDALPPDVTLPEIGFGSLMTLRLLARLDDVYGLRMAVTLSRPRAVTVRELVELCVTLIRPA